MLRPASLLPVPVLLLSLASGVRAQQPAPDSAAVKAAVAVLKSDLRNMVTAQEAFFADHVTYARTMRELGKNFTASRGVTIVLLQASNRGHNEVAIIDSVPGLVCAMWVGDTPAPLGTGREGEPVCKEP